MIWLTTKIINWIVVILMILCFGYQVRYFFSRYLKPKKSSPVSSLHNYAVLIAARNEASVIGNLINSIHQQTYQQGTIDIYVIADNCIDQTAEIAREHGAMVFIRNNTHQIGKGYALQYMIRQMMEHHLLELYDGYFIFDADNILAPTYVEHMNRTFSQGYSVVTSYRNSKNFGSNWLTYSYGIWFLHDSQFLNKGRFCSDSSCMVSGTGYLISKELLLKNDGWNYHLLTEDIEFTADCILNDIPIGYCEDAIFYDEQPVHFVDGWKQRKRWIRGYYQVLHKYGKQLLGKCVHEHSLSSFDMLMANLPMFLLVIFDLVSYMLILCAALCVGEDIIYVLTSIALFGIKTYLGLFILGSYTLLCEWKNIQLCSMKKIIYLFAFPIFMYSYFFVAIAALNKSITWDPIKHTGKEPGNAIWEKA